MRYDFAFVDIYFLCSDRMFGGFEASEVSDAIQLVKFSKHLSLSFLLVMQLLPSRTG